MERSWEQTGRAELACMGETSGCHIPSLIELQNETAIVVSPVVHDNCQPVPSEAIAKARERRGTHQLRVQGS